ncbi:rhodanese-like domain-containing protein [Chloroflexota bacterium]
MNRKKFIMLALSISLVIGILLTGGCAAEKTTTPGTPTQTIEDISTQEAFTLIQNKQNNRDFVILDVRTSEEVADGYIENAVNIDFYSETFRDELDKLDKNKTYLIYCRSGNRSGKARDIMTELNFKEVYNMLGGFVQWDADGLPTTK